MANEVNIEELHQLILECQNGNGSAQERLYNGFVKKFFGVCLRYGADYAEAEDMLQEGFVKLFRKLEMYNFSGSFAAWASRLISNNCIDMLRKKPNLYTLTEEKESSLESFSSEGIDDLYVEDLMNLVHQMPSGYRTVFNMYIVEGYSHREIAERLNISEGTSKSQLNRARKLLQSKLQELKEIEVSKMIKG
ncbi:MAG: RNA polymerase sigma factor (sigma-70 family) [Chitinophagales bacterium]|jgi:RNA polymerase sigma factor (sigma-70 family)